MSLIKLANKETREAIRKAHGDLRDNYFDTRPFLTRHGGKLIGAGTGLGLAALAGEGKFAVLPTLLGAYIGSVSDNSRTIGQFRSGDERFKKLTR